jgi:ribose 5-phosphate isomerase B
VSDAKPKVFIGADHGGFELKLQVREHLQHQGFEVIDEGAMTLDPDDDDVTYAYAVTLKMMAENDPCFGILICRSGQEMAMAANRMTGIRAAVAWTTAVARAAREHNDANVLSLPADFIDTDTALAVVDDFLSEPFSGKERYSRRIKMLDELA